MDRRGFLQTAIGSLFLLIVPGKLAESARVKKARVHKTAKTIAAPKTSVDNALQQEGVELGRFVGHYTPFGRLVQVDGQYLGGYIKGDIITFGFAAYVCIADHLSVPQEQPSYGSVPWPATTSETWKQCSIVLPGNSSCIPTWLSTTSAINDWVYAIRNEYQRVVPAAYGPVLPGYNICSIYSVYSAQKSPILLSSYVTPRGLSAAHISNGLISGWVISSTGPSCVQKGEWNA